MKSAVVIGIILSLAGITACGSSKSNFFDQLAYIQTEDISINKVATSVSVGSSERLFPVFTPDNATDRTVNWYTDDVTKVKVDSSGTITGVALTAEGSPVRVGFRTPDGKFNASCAVTVTSGLTEVTVGTTTTYILPGGTVVKEIATPTIEGVTPQFPMGIPDGIPLETLVDVPAPFIMSETDVTYQLWKEVFDWATSSARGADQYIFDNHGSRGSGDTGSIQQPVTTINWRDAIVWCNALTEYYNANNGSGADMTCVYTYDDVVIRDSTYEMACDGAVQGSTAKGFRLPKSVEYEFAARYRGTDSTNAVLRDGVYYTNGDSASGATAYYNSTATVLVSVYGVTSTSTVKSKMPNALGLYDMSGNVNKWIFDWFNDTFTERVIRGGQFNNGSNGLQVGNVDRVTPSTAFGGGGFRFARNK